MRETDVAAAAKAADSSNAISCYQAPCRSPPAGDNPVATARRWYLLLAVGPLCFAAARAPALRLACQNGARPPRPPWVAAAAHLRVHSATACAWAAPPQRRAPCRRPLQRRCPGASATAGSACTRACARPQPHWARRPPTTTRPLQRRRASAGVGACAPRVCRGGGFGRRRHMRSISRCTSQQRGEGALGDAAHGRRRVWHDLAVARRAAVVRRSASRLTACQRFAALCAPAVAALC